MFTGRISVKDYWKSALLLAIYWFAAVLAGILVAFVSGAFIKTLPVTSANDIFLGITGIFILAAIPPVIMSIVIFVWTIGLQIRRLHDLGFSGWLLLAFWIVNAVVVAFGRTGGTAGFAMYAPWSLVVLVALGLLALGVTLWPGNPMPNAYGAPQTYRSWWAALVGSKEAGSTGGKKGWVIGLAVALVFVAGAAYALWGTGKNANQVPHVPPGPATSNALLAPTVYVTPNGTPVIQPPLGWTSRVSSDLSAYTYVIFNDPQSSAGIAISISSTTNRTTPEAFLQKRFAQQGGTPAPTILSQGPATLGKASGYMIEGTVNWALVGDHVQQGTVTHVRMYELVDGSKTYFIDADALESDWASAFPSIEASLPTLQTP